MTSSTDTATTFALGDVAFAIASQIERPSLRPSLRALLADAKVSPVRPVEYEGFLNEVHSITFRIGERRFAVTVEELHKA